MLLACDRAGLVRPPAYVPMCPRAGIGRQPVTRCSVRRCESSSRTQACAWAFHSARTTSCCGPWQTSIAVPSRGAEAISRNFANRTIQPIYRIFSGSFQYFWLWCCDIRPHAGSGYRRCHGPVCSGECHDGEHSCVPGSSNTIRLNIRASTSPASPQHIQRFMSCSPTGWRSYRRCCRQVWRGHLASRSIRQRSSNIGSASRHVAGSGDG